MNNEETIFSKRATLIISISLPLILVGLLVVSQLYSNYTVADPKYKVLFALQESGSQACDVRGARVSITTTPEGRPNVRLLGLENQYCDRLPSIYIFDPIKKELNQINYRKSLVLPPIPEKDIEVQMPLELFSDWKISSKSPDDYKFEIGDYRSQPTFLFFNPGYNNVQLTISKEGKRISLPTIEDSNYFFGATFLGWVISEGTY